MKHIYLAGPFFSDEQIDRVKKVEAALNENSTVKDFFSPRLSPENENTDEIGSPAWAKRIFEDDIRQIDQSDAVFAITDFENENIDSGTAFEIGYAFNSNIPVVLLQEKDEPLNLMISNAGRYYTKNIDDAATYDFEKLPENTFSGKTF